MVSIDSDIFAESICARLGCVLLRVKMNDAKSAPACRCSTLAGVTAPHPKWPAGTVSRCSRAECHCLSAHRALWAPSALWAFRHQCAAHCLPSLQTNALVVRTCSLHLAHHLLLVRLYIAIADCKGARWKVQMQAHDFRANLGAQMQSRLSNEPTQIRYCNFLSKWQARLKSV